MDDQHSLHRELKEQEFSTQDLEAGEAGYEDRDRYGRAAAVEEVEEEQLQVVGVLGDEQMVSSGDEAAGAVELRWCGGVAVARWSDGVAVARHHAWPGRGGDRW